MYLHQEGEGEEEEDDGEEIEQEHEGKKVVVSTWSAWLGRMLQGPGPGGKGACKGLLSGGDSSFPAQGAPLWSLIMPCLFGP